MSPKHQIMYIEYKENVASLSAIIGKVTISKTGKTLRYKNKEFQSLKGNGWKANYFDTTTGEHYWISGCRKDGNDGLYKIKVHVDENVRQEYWTKIRNLPERKLQDSFISRGKHRVGRQDLKNKTGNL